MKNQSCWHKLTVIQKIRETIREWFETRRMRREVKAILAERNKK